MSHKKYKHMDECSDKWMNRWTEGWTSVFAYSPILSQIRGQANQKNCSTVTNLEKEAEMTHESGKIVFSSLSNQIIFEINNNQIISLYIFTFLDATFYNIRYLGVSVLFINNCFPFFLRLRLSFKVLDLLK